MGRRRTATHGDRAFYTWHGCRCDQCREAERVEHEQCRKRRAYGRADTLVESEVAWGYIGTLLDCGWTLCDVAQALHGPTETVPRINKPGEGRVRRSTVARLRELAVEAGRRARAA